MQSATPPHGASPLSQDPSIHSTQSPIEEQPGEERHALGAPAMAVLTGLLFLLAIWAIHRFLAEVSYRQIHGALMSLSPAQLGWAFTMTVLSFFALTGYDRAALAYLEKPLPYGRVVLATFCGYAIGNAVGFSLLSGGSVRYRIYRAAGLDAYDVARITGFGAIGFGSGLNLIGALALVLHPEALAELLHWPSEWLRGLGVVLLGFLAVGLVLLARRRDASLFGRRFGLPRLDTALMFLGVTLVDIGSCGACLYVLLPDSGVPFGAFLLIFALGIWGGLVSHVPGGLGVFEGVMLYGLGGSVPPDRLAAALIAFRGIYYLIPLVLAVLTLGLLETAERFEPARSRLAVLARWSGPLVPAAVAGLTLIGGLVLLVSSATPAVPARLEWLQSVAPLFVVEVSHTLAALVGLALLVLAPALYRRLNGAYATGLAFCAAGFFLCLAKGADYEEAALLAVLGLALWLNRQHFYRRTALLDEPFGLRWTVALLAALGGMIAVTLFAFKHVEYSHMLWTEFEYDAGAPRAMRATLAVLVFTVPVALWALLRPPKAVAELPGAEQLDAAEAIIRRQDLTLPYLALMGDKSLLFDARGEGFLMFGVSNGTWVALGDPVGPRSVAEELAWEFREQVDREGGRIAFYQTSPELLPLYLDMDLWPLKIGEEAIVDLADFTDQGAAGKDNRYTLKRAERDGLSFEIVPRERFADCLEEIRSISDEWLESRTGREKQFSLGAFDPRYLRHFDTAIVRHHGTAVAFANLLATDTLGESSIDLMRHRAGTPRITMEFLFVCLMLHYKHLGYRNFTLGVAPLSGLRDHRLAPAWHKLGAQLYSHGEPFYNFQGLRQFKEKFHPRWEARYLVTLGGLQPARVLADTAALIAGGYRGLIAK